MGLYRKDRQVLIGFVIRSVLRSVDLEEAASLVGIDSGAGNVDIRLFSHVINFGWYKLNVVKSTH